MYDVDIDKTITMTHKSKSSFKMLITKCRLKHDKVDYRQQKSHWKIFSLKKNIHILQHCSKQYYRTGRYKTGRKTSILFGFGYSQNHTVDYSGLTKCITRRQYAITIGSSRNSKTWAWDSVAKPTILTVDLLFFTLISLFSVSFVAFTAL